MKIATVYNDMSAVVERLTDDWKNIPDDIISVP